MSSKKNDVIEVFQIKPGSSSSSGGDSNSTRLPPPAAGIYHPNDSSVPGVKTKLLVRKGGNLSGGSSITAVGSGGTKHVKSFLSSPSKKGGSKKRRKLTNEEDEDPRVTSVSGGIGNILMTSTPVSLPLPTGATTSRSSSQKFPLNKGTGSVGFRKKQLSSTVGTSTNTTAPASSAAPIVGEIVKLKTKVTTLEEILRSQEHPSIIEGVENRNGDSLITSSDGSDEVSSSARASTQQPCTSKHETSSPSSSASLPKQSKSTYGVGSSTGSRSSSLSRTIVPSESGKVIIREPDIDEVDEDALSSSGGVPQDDDLDESARVAQRRTGSLSCCCGLCSCCTNDGRVKGSRPYAQGSSIGPSGSNSRRYEYAGPSQRLTAMLPLSVQSVVGLISKIYWRIIDGLLGLDPPYRGHGGGEGI